MAKKKRPQPAPQPPIAPSESQAIEALTVAWMLSVMTTLVCISAAGVAWMIARGREEADTVLALKSFLHFSAIVTSLVSLVLMGLVLYSRKVPPPRSIVAFAALVALVPLAAALFAM